YAGEFEVLLGSSDTVAAGYELCRQQMMEMGLVERSVAHRVSHFQSFPLFLVPIKSCVHREYVNVVMRVGYSIDWPGLTMNKLRIDHVRAKAIVLLIAFSHLGFHSGFDRCHRLVNGLSDHFLDELVFIDGQIYRHGFGRTKREIVPGTPVRCFTLLN